MTINDFFIAVFKMTSGSVVVLGICAVLVGFLEGFGITLFLPLLQVLLTGAEGSTSPSALQRFFQTLGMDQLVLWQILLFIVAIFALKNLFSYFQKTLTARVATDFELNIKKGIMQHVLSADWVFFVKEKMGGVINAIETQAKHCSLALRTLVLFYSELIHIVIYCAIGLLISWQAFLASIVASGASYFLLKRLAARTRELSMMNVHERTQSNAHVIEHLGGIKFIKGNHYEQEVKDKTNRIFNKIQRVDYKSLWYLSIVETLPDFIMACLVCSVVFVCHVFLKVPGESLLLLIAVLYRMNKRVIILQNVRQRLNVDIPSFEACHALIGRAKQRKEVFGSRDFRQLEQGVRFKDVSFHYENHENRKILNSINLNIQSKQLTAFVGKSGSGKTTLLDLILGLIQPTSGQIVVDDMPLQQINIGSWRGHVSYVPQDPFMMHDSILENIRMGDASKTRDEVEQATKRAHAYDFIKKQKNGFDTVVGGWGVNLSGGERQRIALARALLRKPTLLILDEATSALDSESERFINEAIKELKGNVTLIVVSHRAEVIKYADAIYYIEEGNIRPAANEDLLVQTSILHPSS